MDTPNKIAPIRPDQKPLFGELGTGTRGPAPRIQPRPAIVAEKTPYGDVLRHIIRTVEGSLKAEDVMMGAEARQDLISTIYIDAAKRKQIEYDFTREVEK